VPDAGRAIRSTAPGRDTQVTRPSRASAAPIAASTGRRERDRATHPGVRLLAVTAVLALHPPTAVAGPSAGAPPRSPRRPATPRAPPVPAGADPVGEVRFRSFGPSEGLRNLVIVGIAQDRAGLLWVATDDGLYRYDGHRFARFSVEDGLPSSSVVAVGIAPDGGVCAGGDGGLACWDGARFQHGAGNGLPTGTVRALASHGDLLWAGTDTGLYVRRGAGDFVRAPGWPGSSATPVDTIWADRAGVAASNGSVVELSTGDGRWREIDAHEGLGSDPIDNLIRDGEGALWIRTTRSMWLLSPGQHRVTNVGLGLPPSYDSSAIASTMAIGPRGEVWVATDAGVAYRRHGAWQLAGGATGLTRAMARTLFVDREGSIWVGSVGLFQWLGRGLIERFDASAGIPGEVVWQAGRDPHGVLWLGTHHCLARAIEGRWECRPGTSGRAVRSFVFLPSGAVFLGGAPGDLLYIGPDGGPVSLGRELDRPDDSFIRALVLGPEGDLWIGTTTGLYRLPGAVPGRLARVMMAGAALDTPVSSLAVADGRLWVGSDAGVVVNDRGRWHRFGQAAGFRAESMPYVVARRDGRACVAYGEALGVTCFRYRDGAVSGLEHIDADDGLISDRVLFMGEDDRGRLWVGSGDGVDVVTPVGVEHFAESDGLAGNESAATAFFRDGDGSLWLGSTAGLTHIDAPHYTGPPAPPTTSVLGGHLGDLPIGVAAPLATPHDHSSLTVEYAADSFLDPGRVEYQVRLDPLEADWSPTRSRFARYAALPPGSYGLGVRARAGGGAWGQPVVLAFEVQRAWWQTRWFLVLLAAGGLAALAGAFTLLQRAVVRRRTQQIQAESSANFRALIESIPDMVSIRSEGKLIYLNQASRNIFGLEGDDKSWYGLDMSDRIHPDDRQLADDLARRVNASGPRQTPEVAEMRLRTGDGSWRSCEVSSMRMEFAGMPVVVATGRDVTDRKRMRDKLLMSDRMASLGTLAAGIAHEINNPLSYVTGNLEVVADALDRGDADSPGPARDELRAALEEAREGAERVRKIVHGLRAFSRPERDERAPLPVQDVLEAAIRLTANEIRHRAELVREIGPTPLVAADDGRLSQVFMNLLVNASHAIPEGAADSNRITVRTRTDEQGRAVVEVEDTGRGMAPEVKAHAFDPFFTTRAVGAGSGLGLSICHGIVTGLGGEIAIESTEGRGCLIRVVLPPAADGAAKLLLEARPA